MTVSELVINRPRSDEFMLIACDGIWNVLTSHAAVSFVREQIAEYKASDKCSKTWLSDIAGQVTSFPPPFWGCNFCCIVNFETSLYCVNGLKVTGWSLKFGHHSFCPHFGQ